MQVFENATPAVGSWEMRRHLGPLAKELFIACRPDRMEEDIVSQTNSVYAALFNAIQQEGGSTEHVLHETVFFRNIRRDLELSRKTSAQAMNSLSGNAFYAPASTLIQQAPVDQSFAIELLAYVLIPEAGPEVTREITSPLQQTGRVFLLGGRKHVLLANICGLPGNSEEEAYSMFQAAGTLLKTENLSFRDVARTWIHLRNIDCDYGGLNSGRTRFFREQGLGLPPASTGIGGAPPIQTRTMCLSLYAIEQTEAVAQPMSTPTLNEAWLYGADFSRGMKIEGPNGITLFISGTASVDERGRTVHRGDFEAQVERMILNISTLLEKQESSWSDVVSAITYLKNPADAPSLDNILTRKGIRGFPNVLVHAPVCRPDLLCEMEAIAKFPLS